MEGGGDDFRGGDEWADYDVIDGGSYSRLHDDGGCEGLVYGEYLTGSHVVLDFIAK